MGVDTLGAILQKLDTEVLLAVIDVALDVDGQLAVFDRTQVNIHGMRTTIRYQELYPGRSVGAAYRYVELRGMGLEFLKKHGIIESADYHKTGFSGFEGYFEVVVKDPRLIEEVLVLLRAEENRRDPGQKMHDDVQSAVARLLQLADSFPSVAQRLRSRRTGRDPLIIRDEYDVQYLFAALLETRFVDVRPEEWGPSYAGGSNRVDFLLKNESVLVETKMTRDGLTDRRLGEELIIDVAHYKQMPGCQALVCFVYDPEHRLTNPRGIESDLSNVTDGLDVRVFIRPET
jgi:hypothetical protein